jgi:hypothetical protein
LVPTVVTFPSSVFQSAVRAKFANSPVPAGREPTPVTVAVTFPGMVSLRVA